MEFSNQQVDSSLPGSNQQNVTASDFLPRYFRTSTNQKFVDGTIDQLLKPGEVDKIDEYIGRKNTVTYKTTDNYLPDVSDDRTNYQLESSLVIKDDHNNVTFFKDYNDYINQIKFFNDINIDHSLLNSQEFYSWDPHIDWDKFVNFREYYWLPNGPLPITIPGQLEQITSTYKVTLQDNGNSPPSYIFTPNGLTPDPTLTLYRGQTYIFEIDCPGHPIAFSTTRTFFPSQSLIIATESGIVTGGLFDLDVYDANLYDMGSWAYNTLVATADSGPFNLYDIWTDGVTSSTVYVEKGIIQFTVPNNVPNVLYYVSKNSIDVSGLIKIYDIKDDTYINVLSDIIGKKDYTLPDGTSLANGMKINFVGHVYPKSYLSDNWYVEGVGNKIYLIAEKDLETPAVYVSSEYVGFDNDSFDTQGFEVNNDFPKEKEYITINRGSKDRNEWSRYNRWFHSSVIKTSYTINNQPIDIDQNTRAKRPIIEFNAGLQLFQHGRQAKKDVDVIDTFTTDVFSTIEGSLGYNIDGIQLIDGMRVLFTADTDKLVNGRIFQVKIINFNGRTQIALVPTSDSVPINGETVLVLLGDENRGKMFYYTDAWYAAQGKSIINQPPLFDVFDVNGNSYSDKTIYVGTNFVGSKIFSYAEGQYYDKELKFNIKYQNINNIGDIVFDFNLHTDNLIYYTSSVKNTITFDTSYVYINDGLQSTSIQNGWTTSNFLSNQPVVRQYDVLSTSNFFAIDVYDKSGELTDLKVKVWVNGVRQTITDYDIYVKNSIAYVRFFVNLEKDDVVIIESTSIAKKNNNGFYKFPQNLDHNPKNISLTSFTLGEITNHVQTIAENIDNFYGKIPGQSNLKDLGNVSGYGTRIIQHSSPLIPVAYHITNSEFNIISALRYAKEEYSKFKGNLLRTAQSYTFDGTVANHLDALLKEVTKNNTNSSPFYLSDMIPYGSYIEFNQTVIDNEFTIYPLSFEFDLNTLSEKAILIYLNDELLLAHRDYTFVNNQFVQILTPIVENDELRIVQYSSTDGCFVPYTPSKLGLYPVYEPKMFLDTTYQEPTTVIQGHDGSITVAFGDYRDDLLIEFEKRIFNNIKVKSAFDINEFITSFTRKTDLPLDDLNEVLSQEFLKWSLNANVDFLTNSYFKQENPFTFNYNKFYDSQNVSLPGYWRGIFKYFYDTDKPNITPWEMLGFTVKPTWWEEVYGIAPYTSDNLILWEDIANGIIREPNKQIQYNSLYSKPFILNHCPVDEFGELKDPLAIGIVNNYNSIATTQNYIFGDWAPVESAWRKSADYPFSLLISLILNRPAKIFAVGFDVSRQVRDGTGQLIYKTDRGNLRFNFDNAIIPSTTVDSTRVFTSGLVNYIVDYTISKSITLVEKYKSDIKSLNVNLTCKIGGYSSKDKFNLILDSRVPNNNGNVFIPHENYDLFYNVSSPINSVRYSGVIVEKQSNGFVIRGYDRTIPSFNYYEVVPINSDPVINVGGISESFVDWSPNVYYTDGTIVRYNQKYYRTVTTHTSPSAFEEKYFVSLPYLPIVGGRNIILRSKFNQTQIKKLPYGYTLLKIQDVVDFLLGYEKYLKTIGFTFDYYDKNLEVVSDWQLSCKEFAFWTTQNWAEGSVISLSPGANEVQYHQVYSTVDDLNNNFYEYSVYKEDGTVLDLTLTNGFRSGNYFSLQPKNTESGIYHATLNLVQKEHVLILDNVTIFNDIIYNQIQGYRQERIKVLGYRTANWDGSFNIPGFVFDQATITDWKPWHDYNLGEIVKYQEFYYSAKYTISGSESFVNSQWSKLPSKPTPKLFPNWDYMATEFLDFYDLETDSFDIQQQKFAQHLIGYQPRQYLSNIINDDVAQYKFYQGMIRDKGTLNCLSKLFDSLSSANEDSLNFYEEWAIRLGQYGGSDAFDELEIKLDESKFLLNPQPFEIVNKIISAIDDNVYRLTKSDLYIKPKLFDDTNLFPINEEPIDYINTAGYVRASDVQYIFKTKDQLLDLDLSKIKSGDYFWIGFDENVWDVYRFGTSSNTIKKLQLNGAYIRVVLNEQVVDIQDYPEFSGNNFVDYDKDDYIALNNTNGVIDGIYQIESMGVGYFEIVNPGNIDQSKIDIINSDNKISLLNFQTQRLENIDNLSQLKLVHKKDSELVWTDNINDWIVWKYEYPFSTKFTTHQTKQFGYDIAVNDNNTTLVISAYDKVMYYARVSTDYDWPYIDEIDTSHINQDIDDTNDYTNTNGTFGNAITLSHDGETLLISAPGYNSYQGYVTKFIKDHTSVSDKDTVVKYTSEYGTTYRSPDPQDNEQFGFRTAIYNQFIVIASKGDGDVVPGSIATYKLNTINTTSPIVREPFYNVQVTDMSVSNSGYVSVGTTDEIVYIYKISNDGSLLLVQQLTYTTKHISFGISSDITNDGQILAVGAPYFNRKNPDEGTVFLYKLDSLTGQYVYWDQVNNIVDQESERFGYSVRFNTVGDQLVVYSLGGYQYNSTTFDGDNTSFDLDITNFVDPQQYVGSVHVFDKYNTSFIYSDDLIVRKVNGTNYGSQIYVTDRIYVNDYTNLKGSVYEFTQQNKSWTRFRTADKRVDFNKIKSIFLYDAKKNSIVTHLDFIDPIGGKILGIADQEVNFKTYYDPATYSIGTNEVVVDSLLAWSDNNIGKLWWDLSTIKFINPYQGTSLYKSNTWNTIFPGSSVDVYEWVASTYSPAEWDVLADTEEGLTLDISGKSKYGDNVYSSKQVYDNVTKTFTTIYYFWVKNKTITPNVSFRHISASDVASYIADPKSQGIEYAIITGTNQISLVNCKELLNDTDVILNIRYWLIEDKEINVHNHYKLLSENDDSITINPIIESKWYDSLVGYDQYNRTVPDPALPVKLKYGILTQPRQSMFINRNEALKEFITRVNKILIQYTMVDNIDFNELSSKDQLPSDNSFDVSVPTFDDLRFITLYNKVQAQLIPNIEKGRIKSVTIVNRGTGYAVSPTITVKGTGSGAQFKVEIDQNGSIADVIVEKEGQYYDESTSLIVRPYTILVENDENINGLWSKYTSSVSKQWVRVQNQTYDTTKYWEYVDWYKENYSQYIKVDKQFEYTYELFLNNTEINDIIKINNHNLSGWILLKKINNINTFDISTNYEVVGRQNGTIQFKSNLYDYIKNNIGYDGTPYDGTPYDEQPVIELRIILNAIKNTLLDGSLKIEYNNAFFASLKYIFREQPFVDWVFKTSFIKAKYNIGELSQPVTFQTNNIDSYIDYINEVKPYRTKIREYVNNFTALDNTSSAISDFDLPVRYDSTLNQLVPIHVTVGNYGIEYDSTDIFNTPYVWWYNNVGYSVIEIKLLNKGSGYKVPPIVTIVGNSNEQATAKAYISNGSINKIELISNGSGYLKLPEVVINGASLTSAKAIAVLGNSPVRTFNMTMKFDRVSYDYSVNTLNVTQQFVSSGTKLKFDLKWPIDIRPKLVSVTIDGYAILSSEYSVYNNKTGVLQFTNAPVSGSVIVIKYRKDVTLLNSADRIQYYYNSGPGKLGKDLSQLMTGIDYGGVEVTGINFDIGMGWNTVPWNSTGWDQFDPNNTDYLIKSFGTIRTFTLPYVPKVNQVITIYVNNVRVDDPFYGTPEQTNETAVMTSFIGDGINNTIILPDEVVLNETTNIIIFRDSTSDGSSVPESTYDVTLEGGKFEFGRFSSALGVSASEIIVDGDDLITPITSYAPEEVIPGHVVDTLDIRVFTKESETYSAYGFRVFKDMLNRFVYKRIDDSTSTELSQEFNWGDTSISVVNTSNLTIPDKMNNKPGVIIIGGERIEYFEIIDNTLSQLRRGTYGTGIPSTYPIGTLVRDQSAITSSLTNPDRVERSLVVSDGVNNLINISFVPKLVSGTQDSSWFRETIPLGYGQSNDIEVFVGGQRLRKIPMWRYNIDLGPDSPSGDEHIEAEFAVDGVNNTIWLTTVPAEGVVIQVQRRVGLIWTQVSESIGTSTSVTARFLREKPVNLPA